MFCQACGAKNAKDARFCNKCGARIAPPGQPGGLLSGPGPEAGGGTNAADPAPTAVAAPAPGPAPAPAPEASGPRAVAGRGGTMVLGSKQAVAAGAPAGPQVAPGSPTPNGPAPAPPSPARSEDVWAAHDGGGGAAAEAHPHPRGYLPPGDNPTITNVTLASMGIRSPSKAWGLLLIVSLVLFAFGAAAMWFWVRPTGDSGAEGSEAADASGSTGESGESAGTSSDIAIGTPLPAGVDAPARDFVAGASRSSQRSTTMRTGSGRTASSSVMRSSSGMSTSMTSTSRSGSSSPSAMAGGSGSTMSSTGSSTTMSTAVPTNRDVPEERDIETDLYAGRVRYVISRYYASRAQGCFDRATRNAASVRGTVVVGFTIGSGGQITRSSVGRNTTGNDSLGQCLANQVRTWRLPAPPGGQPMSLEMPFSR